MTFGAMAFLYALPLAALPVLFHLLMQRRRQAMPFSTFLFFFRSDPRIASRRRIKEILLLALRVLFIACLVFALSRPQLGCRRGQGGPTDLVLVVDNSASMSAPSPNGETKLQRAVSAAKQRLQFLAPESRVSIALLVADPEVPLFPGLSSDPDQWVAVLDAIRPTHATGRPARALHRALHVLRTPAPRGPGQGAIAVFSDLQEAEWRETIPIKGADAESIALTFYRIPTRDAAPPNVSVASVTFPERRVLPGQVVLIEVAFRNHHASPLVVRLHMQDNHRTESLRSVNLPAYGLETLSWSMTPLVAGVHWMHISIDGDAFVADNNVFIGLECRPRARILLRGTPTDFGILPLAISPSGDGRYTGLRPEFCAAAALVDRLRSPPPLLVACSWKGLEETRGSRAEAGLRSYVENGGALLILPAAGGAAQPVDVPAWVGAAPDGLVEREELVIEVADRESPLWGDLRTSAGRTDFRYVMGRRARPLRLDPSFAPLLVLDASQPVLAARPMGAGWIYASGFAFDPAWTDLATDPAGAGMLLVHQMALRARPSDAAPRDVQAGVPLPDIIFGGEDGEVFSIVGDPTRRRLSPGDSLEFPRAGVFFVRTPDREMVLSVRPSPREGSSGFLRPRELMSLWAGLARVMELRPDGSLPPSRVSAGSSVPLFFPLLVTAIVLWMAEAWIETSSRTAPATHREETA